MLNAFIICIADCFKFFHKLWKNLKGQIFHKLWKTYTRNYSQYHGDIIASL